MILATCPRLSMGNALSQPATNVAFTLRPTQLARGSRVHAIALPSPTFTKSGWPRSLELSSIVPSSSCIRMESGAPHTGVRKRACQGSYSAVVVNLRPHALRRKRFVVPRSYRLDVELVRIDQSTERQKTSGGEACTAEARHRTSHNGICPERYWFSTGFQFSIAPLHLQRRLTCLLQPSSLWRR